MRKFLWASEYLLVGGLILGACDGHRRGGAGETCTATDDCRSGLACVSAVCAPEADSGAPSGSGLPAGASCVARRDCAPGLVCTSNACTAAGTGSDPAAMRYGGRGESCQAKNDCEPDLACIGNTCRDVNLSLSRKPKSCYRVECAETSDCCAAFSPNVNCATYKTNCETDPIFCNTYRSLCECSQDCEGELCVTAPPGCVTNAECTSSQTPYCLKGKCRQCEKDSSCTGAGTKCVEGVCTAACTIAENCPALHSCQDGVCIETGCTSDRECAFMQKNPFALCQEGKCHVPCDTDTDCKGEMPEDGFEVCEQGSCVFVGCESDAECRELLDLVSQPGKARAICR